MIRYAAVFGALLVGGCAAQSSSYQQRLEVLQDKVLILQNERDRFEERLIALETRLENQGAGSPQAASATGEPRPAADSAPANLPVVRLAPRPEVVPSLPAEPSVAIVGSGDDVGVVTAPLVQVDAP